MIAIESYSADDSPCQNHFSGHMANILFKSTQNNLKLFRPKVYCMNGTACDP